MADETDDPYYSELRNVILPDAEKQPDRYYAIVMSAIIEEELGEYIQSTLVDDESVAKQMFRRGALSSFFAKINMGYLLGLYPKEFADMLHSIRDIRNRFAHRKELLQLSSPEIKELMKGVEVFVFSLPLFPRPRKERDIFSAGCRMSLGALSVLQDKARRLRSPKPGEGPHYKFFRRKLR